jgi:EmrB/QacA subfamily drug resistance transporter
MTEHDARRRWTLIAVCTATFMLLVDITIVNVGLPSIQRDFSAGLSGLQWVVDAYALSLASLMLTAGSLADRFGRRAVFAAGVAVFTVASLLCGAAPGIGVLDLARGVQGIGGAAMFATGLALLAQEYEGPARGRAIAVWGATVGVAVATGPVLGGAVTDTLGWRWIFLVNVPIGAAALLVARLRMRGAAGALAARVDAPGLVAFSGALFLLVLGLLRATGDGWTSAPVLGSLAGAAALLAAFVAVERRAAQPMLDLALFRSPGFVGVSAAVFCLGAGMFALITFLSLYLQTVLGYSPLAAGLRLLPMSAFVFLVPTVMHRRGLALSSRVAIGTGLALVALGLLAMHGVGPGSGWLRLLPGLVLAGLGIGIANPAIGQAAIAVCEPARAGMASGFNNTCRLGGIAVGLAALGTVFEHAVRAALAPVPGAPPAAAVTSAGARVAGTLHGAAQTRAAELATGAFVAGLNDLFLVGAGTVSVGALAAFALLRPRPAGEAAGAPMAERAG